MDYNKRKNIGQCGSVLVIQRVDMKVFQEEPCLKASDFVSLGWAAAWGEKKPQFKLHYCCY